MISKLNSIFCRVAILSLCLKVSLAGTLKPTPIIIDNGPFDIQSEIQRLLVLNFLWKGSNATTLEDLEKPQSFRSLDFQCWSWTQLDSILAILRLLGLPESGAFRSNVHEIRISRLNSELSTVILSQLENIIPKLENLAILRWEDNQQLVTPSILKVIENHNPPVKLYYSLSPNAEDYRNEDAQDFEQAELIPSSSSLQSLKVHNKYSYYSNEMILGLIFNALISSPNINELDLSFPKEKSYHGPNAFDFAARVGEKFSPLRILRLDGYNFDSQSIGRRDEASEEGQYRWGVGTDHVHATELRRGLDQQKLLPAEKTIARSNMEWWLVAMDWSQIQVLEFNLPSYKTLHFLHRLVPSLSKLSLHSRKFEDIPAIVEFIANVGALEFLELLDLRLDNFDSLLKVIISGKHHESLKSLSLTGRNYLDTSNVLCLNSTTIQRLLSSLPRLESLSLTISSTEEEWNYLLFQTLAFHHKISHLTFHVDNSADENDIPNSIYSRSRSHSLINATSLPGLFHYMRKHKVGVPLETLTVCFSRLQQKGSYWLQDGPQINKEDNSDKYVIVDQVYKCSLSSIDLEVCKIWYPNVMGDDYD